MLKADEIAQKQQAHNKYLKQKKRLCRLDGANIPSAIVAQQCILLFVFPECFQAEQKGCAVMGLMKRS